jgi:hypothetical protein
MEAMRLSTRALVSVIVIACGSFEAAGAETGSRWWPFGHKEDAAASQSGESAVSSSMQTNLPSIPVAPQSTTSSAARQSESPLAVAPPPAGVITQHGAALATPTASGPVAHESQLPASTTAEEDSKERWMFKSQKHKISWPHLNKEPSKGGPLFGSKEKTEAARNTWVEKKPLPKKPATTSFTDGAHKLSSSTKNAWHKTVDALTPGDSSSKAQAKRTSPRIAKRDTEPSFWSKMFGSKQELQQPKTVPEWMAQQRLDP